MTMLDAYLDPATVALLCQAFGGRRISIPKTKSGQAWERLVDALGEDRAGSVVRWFENETVFVPMAPDRRPAEAVLELHAAGVSVKEIATYTFPTRLSERHIRRIIAADRSA